MITEATFDLTDNVKVKRQDETIPIADYPAFFAERVRPMPDVVFHNGDIYPDSYDTVHAITYTKADEAVTIGDRLMPEHASYRLNRFVYWVVSEWPFGKPFRQEVLDPLLFRGNSVTWRNYQASYDAAELEPASRQFATYALEEYFVPVNRFKDFAPRM